MNDFDFSRQRRLLTAGDYRRVFEKAQFKVSDQHLLILARPGQTSQSRLGLVIAKKHLKRAVDRNRVKRILRESFRTLEPPLEPAMDIVVLARKGLGEIEKPALQRIFNKQWRRLAKKMQQSAEN
ncbi:MAG: ribonuclease P protein component [Pseudomonadales bacterium]|jgi:ribonuclease P protein component